MDCIWVLTSVRDEEALMPFFLRHYGEVADRIIVYDNGSQDRTITICKSNPLVTVVDRGLSGLDEYKRLQEAYDFILDASDKAEWCVIVDADEFIVGNFYEAISESNAAGSNFCLTNGWNMLGKGLPKDNGKQIYRINPMGLKAPVYGKPVVVRSGTRFSWVLGKHKLQEYSGVLVAPQLHLLHYRYMGLEYTRARNARNYERCLEKAWAWSCKSDYMGEHSAEWAEAIRPAAINVLKLIVQNPKMTGLCSEVGYLKPT